MGDVNLRLSNDEAKFLLALISRMPDPIALLIHKRLVEAIGEEEPPEKKTYIVKKGDTLWDIAEKQYGKGKGQLYKMIFEANKPPLVDADEIYPGQELNIPPAPR
jgi:nucleoid-associated protein YgaU